MIIFTMAIRNWLGGDEKNSHGIFHIDVWIMQQQIKGIVQCGWLQPTEINVQ